MKYLIAILVTLIIFSSCKGPRILTETVTVTELRDTTIFVEKLIPVDRLINVPIPGHTDTLYITDVVNISNGNPTMKSIHKEQGIIAVDAKIYNGIFSLQAYLTDSSILYHDKYTLTFADSFNIHNAISTTKTNTTKTLPPVKYVPKFYKTLLWINIFILLLIVAIIFTKVKGISIQKFLKNKKVTDGL